ncbi:MULTISPECIES: AlbA family DNA-binding domain-containing protein [Sorangium]|uniref:AlbA family DNA-binding domain-containing protein n=1 Tax=Sorangium TaxID=39643 RepID=UPI003D9C1D36
MYATYRRIETFADVPPAGPLDAKVRETHRLDFKETASPEKTAEHAKDMAAFANTFGGVILIGSKVEAGIVEHPGISRSHASRLAEVYEQTAKEMCSPSPVVNAIIIPAPGNFQVLLAINIDPFVEGPIGAKLKEQDAWLFPVREASHTKYLRPNELPMYMNPKVRRTILLLDCIRNTDSVQLWMPPGPSTEKIILRSMSSHHVDENAYGPLELEPINVKKGDVDLAKNSAIFGWEDTEGPYIRLIRVGVPLTDIEDIWQTPENRWNVRLGGRIIPPQNGSESWVATYCPVVR